MKRWSALVFVVSLSLAACGASAPRVQETATSKSDVAKNDVRTPGGAVREFYTRMRGRRFREAFALTIYNPAIEGLNQVEYEELLPDFEQTAASTPEQVNITGEQISGDVATVFIKTKVADAITASPTSATSSDATKMKETIVPVTLKRNANSVWIIGEEKEAEAVRAAGKEFFFKVRLNAHHAEAQKMLQRIALAQLAYSAQHEGRAADLHTLVRIEYLPPDVETSESTGYKYQVTLGKDAKSFAATATPARYGRSGVLSFFMDANGVRSKDAGGKMLTKETATK